MNWDIRTVSCITLTYGYENPAFQALYSQAYSEIDYDKTFQNKARNFYRTIVITNKNKLYLA